MKLLVLPMAAPARADPLARRRSTSSSRRSTIDPRPAMEYFGFPFRRLAEDGLREYLR